MSTQLITYPKAVTINEVGLRDGIQNESYLLNIDEKINLLESIYESNINVIEVGSFVHPKAIPQMANVIEFVTRMPRKNNVQYRALVPNITGLKNACALGIDKAKLTVCVTESHCISNFNQLPLDMMKSFEKCVSYATNHKIELSGAMASAWGCAYEGNVSIDQVDALIKLYLEYDIKELSLSDATGMANPKQVYTMSRHFIEKYPEVTWILHLHDTRGMALANIVAAMQAGISNFDGSFAGLGGCPYLPNATGNIATEDLVHMLHEMGISTGIDLEKAIGTGKLAEQIVNHQGTGSILRSGRNCDLSLEKPHYQKND